MAWLSSLIIIYITDIKYIFEIRGKGLMLPGTRLYRFEPIAPYDSKFIGPWEVWQ